MTSASLVALAGADFARLRACIPVAELRGKRILVTGATGFFGAWLLALFNWMNKVEAAGVSVLVVSRNPAAFLARHPDFADAPWLTWIAGDVRDFSCPPGTVDGVIHAATDTSAAAGKNPSLLFDTIVEGTRHVLAVARQSGAGRVALVSSGAVYGAQMPNITHMTEDTRTAPSPLNPASAYGEGKRVMEMLGTIYGQETGTPVITARCFAFVGAGLPLDGHFAIGNFIRDALSQDKISIKSGGTAERSYLYAADLAIWLVRLLMLGEGGQAYNVGSDQALSIADLARTVVGVLAPDKPVVIEGKDDPHNRHRYIPSVAKARTACGVDVWTDLTQAISLTAAYRP